MSDSPLRGKKRIPLYVPVTFFIALGFQMLIFYGTRPLLAHRTLHILTTALDDRIPFSPPWVVVYFLSFLFWIVSVLWIVWEDKQHAYRFASYYMINLLIAGAVFLIYPGTMAQPEITGSGFFDNWMRFLYAVDTPTNLCPSLHVAFSYCCWRGVLESRIIPRWYAWFSLVFTILVCLCVVFVKQHAVIDVPAGLVCAEVAWQIARLTRPERIWFAVERKLMKNHRKK